MTFCFHQAYPSQAVDVAYQDPNNRHLQQLHQMHAKPVSQEHQMYRDAGMQQQIDTELALPQQIHREEDMQQHAQLYRAEDIQQHTQIYRKITRAPQTEVSLLLPHTAHICNICNKQCKSERELQSHHASHPGKRVHTCGVCHKGFTQKSELQTHYLSKSHACHICNRGFTHRRTLRRHRLIHSGEKAHICDVCHRGFIQKTDLHIHYSIHTGEKLHVCHVCNQDFTLKHNLRKHSLIHTGQIPHVGDICNRFTPKISLGRHYLTHTGEKNHICEICNKGFALKHDLRRHYLAHFADRKGERKRGEGTGIKASEDEKTIAVIVEALQQQQQQDAEQQSEHVEKNQPCDIKFADKSGPFDQASMYGEYQVFLENSQAWPTVDKPLTHMVHQAFNNTPQGLHPLNAVDHLSLAQLGSQALAQILHQEHHCTDRQLNM